MVSVNWMRQLTFKIVPKRFIVDLVTWNWMIPIIFVHSLAPTAGDTTEEVSADGGLTYISLHVRDAIDARE